MQVMLKKGGPLSYTFGGKQFNREVPAVVADSVADELIETGLFTRVSLDDTPAKGKTVIKRKGVPTVEGSEEIPALPANGFKTKKLIVEYAKEHFDLDLNINRSKKELTALVTAAHVEKYGAPVAEEDNEVISESEEGATVV